MDYWLEPLLDWKQTEGGLEITIIAKFKVGDRCRCLHYYAYRGKEPFTIVSIATSPIEGYQQKFRYIYIIQYDDGVLDATPVENEGGYIIEKIKEA